MWVVGQSVGRGCANRTWIAGKLGWVFCTSILLMMLYCPFISFSQCCCGVFFRTFESWAKLVDWWDALWSMRLAWRSIGIVECQLRSRLPVLYILRLTINSISRWLFYTYKYCERTTIRFVIAGTDRASMYVHIIRSDNLSHPTAKNLKNKGALSPPRSSNLAVSVDSS